MVSQSQFTAAPPPPVLSPTRHGLCRQGWRVVGGNELLTASFSGLCSWSALLATVWNRRRDLVELQSEPKGNQRRRGRLGLNEQPFLLDQTLLGFSKPGLSIWTGSISGQKLSHGFFHRKTMNGRCWELNLVTFCMRALCSTTKLSPFLVFTRKVETAPWRMNLQDSRGKGSDGWDE